MNNAVPAIRSEVPHGVLAHHQQKAPIDVQYRFIMSGQSIKSTLETWKNSPSLRPLPIGDIQSTIRLIASEMRLGKGVFRDVDRIYLIQSTESRRSYLVYVITRDGAPSVGSKCGPSHVLTSQLPALVCLQVV